MRREFAAAHPRHRIIQDDQVKRFPRKAIQRLPSILSLYDGVPVDAQEQLDGVTSTWVVLDEEDALSNDSGLFHNKPEYTAVLVPSKTGNQGQ